jgi:hypothetical protein
LLLVMEKLNGPDLFDAFAKKQLGGLNWGIGPPLVLFFFPRPKSLFASLR